MSYNNNNRGNYEQRGNNRPSNDRGGRSNGRQGGRGNNRDDADFLRASSFKWTRKDYNESSEPKPERVELVDGVHEAIGFSLAYDKVQEFISKLAAASESSDGSGSVYVNLFAKKSENRKTGEVFDGLSILVNAMQPREDNNRRRGGSFNNNRGGGRRDYPKQNQSTGQHGGTSRTDTMTKGHDDGFATDDVPF